MKSRATNSRRSLNPCDAHFRRVHRDMPQMHMTYTAFMRGHACLATLRIKTEQPKRGLDCCWQYYLALTEKLHDEQQSFRARIFSVERRPGEIDAVLLIPRVNAFRPVHAHRLLRQAKAAGSIAVKPYDVELVGRTFLRSGYSVWMWSGLSNPQENF